MKKRVLLVVMALVGVPAVVGFLVWPTAPRSSARMPRLEGNRPHGGISPWSSEYPYIILAFSLAIAESNVLPDA